uniref:39S ribosomal protein L2, mitochondrial n=1 Tax=Magallana gigas TaxID=29159 RepID=K1PWT6_MAGGI
MFFSSSYGRQFASSRRLAHWDHCSHHKKDPWGGRARLSGLASAQVLRKVGNKAILRLPSKHEIALSFNCMVTEGQVSNSGHDDIPWKGVGEKVSAGYRPKTGWHDRKTCYNGKKIKPKRTFNLKPTPPKYEIYKLSGTEVYVLFLWR